MRVVLYESLAEVIEDHESVGATCADGMLGIKVMPSGYSLMLNADQTHFYWVRYDGLESCICWDKWACYRGAKRDKELDEGR